MTSSWPESDDPARVVDVDRAKVVQAYDDWRQNRDRPNSGKSHHSDVQFKEAIAKAVGFARRTEPARLGIPGSRSGWSTWRTKKDSPLVRLRLDVCRAIRTVTSHDVTSNGFLQRETVNTTELVTLGRVVAATNTTLGGENSLKKLTVESIAFRIGRSTEVCLSDISLSAKGDQRGQRIGSVRYSLREAALTLANAKSIEPFSTYLQPAQQSQERRTAQLTVSIDNDRPGSWRIQPIYPFEVLQSEISDMTLCRCDLSTEIDSSLVVSVEKEDINPQITFDFPEDRTRSSYQIARQKLMEQLLRHKSVVSHDGGGFVLSFAGISQDE